MALTPLQDGIDPLEIWGRTLWHIQTDANILHDHLRPTARFFSERPLDGLCHSVVHVRVMVWLVAEGGVRVNQLEILF